MIRGLRAKTYGNTRKLFEEVAQQERRTVLAAVCAVYSITEACKIARISRAAYYQWRQCPVFRAASDRAQEIASGMLLEEAFRRGYVGDVHVKLHQGQPVMVPALDKDSRPIYRKAADKDGNEFDEMVMLPLVERKRSDRLLAKMIDGHFPQFRPNYIPPRTVDENQLIQSGFTNQQMRDKITEKLEEIITRIADETVARAQQAAEPAEVVYPEAPPQQAALPSPEPPEELLP